MAKNSDKASDKADGNTPRPTNSRGRQEPLSAVDVLKTRSRRYAGRRCTLHKVTADDYHEFLERIRLGCYDYIAAQSLGICPETLYRWIRQGREAESGIYRQFYLDVMEAQGEARRLAELQVFAGDPKFWLVRGPGKRAWSERVEIEAEIQARVEDLDSSQEEDASPLENLALALKMAQEYGLLPSFSEGLKSQNEELTLDVESAASDDSELSSDNPQQ